MIILNEAQIKAWDAYTIAKGISSLALMEQAAVAVTDKLDLLLGEEDQEVLIICGNGNNGADGLAIARLLLDMDYIVDVFVSLEGDHTPEWKANYERLMNQDPEQLEIHTVWNPEEIELSTSGTIVDAMFGTGLKRPIDGKWLEITNWVNEQSNLTVAIDMPSGLYVDRAPDGEVVYADLVLTFQCQRLAFMMPESEPHFGEVLVCNIGLSDTFLLEHDIRNFELSYYYLLPFLIDRNRFSHKGDYGHGFLLSGSLGKAGAAVLASGAAMRAGLGLLTVHVPGIMYSILQSAVPEAMVHLDANPHYISSFTIPDKIAALGIGPGLGKDPVTIKAVEKLLETKLNVPMVWDADALNILAERKDLLDKLPVGSIITPHPGEFDRLFGEQDDHYSRFATAQREAQQRKINIVLKGGITIICQSNGVSFFNTRGNPGMATGGSGDVLTGVILGLLSQGYSSDYASLLGVYIHASAGDLAAEEQGYESLIASDIVEYLGDAFEELRHREPSIDETEEKMSKIIVLTGAGISAESGIRTFRDAGGLWEGYRIEDVATPEAWHRNPEVVLEFYNERRKQLLETTPNAAHSALVDLEAAHDIIIITQNVDDLHERAGSQNIIHLHGELLKARSSGFDHLVYEWKKDIHTGDMCEKGFQLRPHIVWFGEMVPMLEKAIDEIRHADVVIVIGSSMQVYPAASLVAYAPLDADIYYIDPNPQLNYELSRRPGLQVIPKPASIGVAEVISELSKK